MARGGPEGGRLRVNLERLLLACERMAASELHQPDARRRYETFLAVLQRYWHELAAATKGANPSLGEYRRKIEHLTDLVDTEKLRSSVSLISQSQAHNQAHITREQANEELANRVTTANRVHEELRRDLVSKLGVAAHGSLASTLLRADKLPSRPTAGSESSSNNEKVQNDGENLSARGAQLDASHADENGGTRGCGKRGPSFGAFGAAKEFDAADSERFQQIQRQLQESLIDETAQMAAELRERSLLSRKAITADCSTLDSSSKVLDGNQASMDSVMPRLQEQLKRMKQSNCHVWLMMLVVTILFVLTFIVMKIFPKRKIMHSAHAPPIYV